MNQKIYISLAALTLSYSVATSQNANFKIMTAEKSGEVNISALSDDYSPTLKSLEAPFPGSNPDKILLNEAKTLSAQKFPRKNIGAKSITWGQAPQPNVLKGYITNLGSGIPPDNYVAVSNTNKVITVANSSIYMHDGNSDSLMTSKTLQTFSSAAGLGGFNNYKYDPKVIYDPKEDKYMAVILNGTDQNNYIVLGFSQSNDPLGTWNFYKLLGNIFQDSTWFDYPAISITNGELFLTGNQLGYYTSWQLGFKQTVIYQIRKADGYAGAPLTMKLWSDIKYQNKPLRCLYPVKGGGDIYGPNQYFLSNRNFAVQNDSIFLVEVTDTVNAPGAQLNIQLIKMDKPYGVSPNARQPNIAAQLATKDGRVLAGFYQADEIQFLSNSIDTLTGSSGIYHGKIKNVQSGAFQTSSAILSMDTLDFGYPNMTFIETIGGQHKSIITFNYSGPNSFPGFAAVYCGGDTYSNLEYIKKGESGINQLTGIEQRWGDYSGSQRVWSEMGSIWVSGIFGKTNKYNSYVAKIGPYNLSTESQFPQYGKIEFYPNPGVEFVNVKFKNPKTENLYFEIFDLKGQKVSEIFNGKTQSGENLFQFSVAPLSPGTYFLRIRNGENIIENHKFIKL